MKTIKLVNSIYPCQDVPCAVFENRCSAPCLYCGLHKYKFPDEKIITTGEENVIQKMSNYKGTYFSPVTDCFLPENCELTHRLLEKTWGKNPNWVPLVNTKQSIPEKTIALFEKHKDSLVLQISIPSSNEYLVSLLEPSSLLVSKRFELIKKLTTNKIPIIVVIMPWFDIDQPEIFAKKLFKAGVSRTIIANGILTEKTKQRMINSGNELIKLLAESTCFIKEATENGYVLPFEQRVASLKNLTTALGNFGIKTKVCISDNHDLENTNLPLCGKFKHHNFKL